MSTSMVTLMLVALGALVAFVFVKKGRDIYDGRKCQGAKWRKQFPKATKDEIQDFLRFFSSAFAVRRKHFLLLSPQDELVEIYRTRYPSRADPDALEFETLYKDLRKTYGLRLELMWHDHLTVGELFNHVINAQHGTPTDLPTASKSKGETDVRS